MPGKIYPKEKNNLLELLSPDDLKIIQVDYPYKNLRNEKIRELMQKGVSCLVLAEITDLSKSSIHRIGKTGVNKYLSADESAMKNSLIQIEAIFDNFVKEIRKILKRR